MRLTTYSFLQEMAVIYKGFVVWEANKKLQKLPPFVKIAEKCEGVHIHYNNCINLLSCGCAKIVIFLMLEHVSRFLKLSF